MIPLIMDHDSPQKKWSTGRDSPKSDHLGLDRSTREMLGSEPLIVGLVLERKFHLDVDCPNPKLLRVNLFSIWEVEMS